MPIACCNDGGTDSAGLLSAEVGCRKGKGNGSIEAAYNTYMHASNLVINDQFTGAYTRDNLVTVECEVPVSEVTSGYHAEYAKDSVGWHSWHTGTVAGQIRKEKGIERQVFLSRWIKPVRIVSDAEVASMYKTLLDGTDIAVPDNVVTPSLRNELKKAGVKLQESGKVRYSISGEYWSPDMSKSDVDTIRHVAGKDLGSAKGYLDSRTKSLYTKVKGEHYFAMYSTEDTAGPDGTDNYPNILYASKGDEAVFDKLYTDKAVAQYKEGAANVGTAGAIDAWTRTVRSQLSKGAGHIDALLGGRSDQGDAEVYGRASRRKPSDALRNCLNNLQLEPDELLGRPSPELSQARYSITGENDAVENEKAIRKLENEIGDINSKLDLASVDGLSETEVRRLRNQLTKWLKKTGAKSTAKKK